MVKRRVIIGSIIVLLGFALFAVFSAQNIDSSRLAGDISGASMQEDNDDVIVFKTKSGNCFHVEGCSYLRGNGIPISYGKAKSEGLEPCSRCGAYRWVNY